MKLNADMDWQRSHPYLFVIVCLFYLNFVLAITQFGTCHYYRNL